MPGQNLINGIRHFYPRSPCGERPAAALYAGGVAISISIHALLAESDKRSSSTTAAIPKFLSTLSLRRATEHNMQLSVGTSHFYPRSPCGERLNRRPNHIKRYEISIHALLAESDRTVGCLYSNSVYFYPRSPCGERLTLIGNGLSILTISIHALLAESDLSFFDFLILCIEISIHALLAESD